MKISFKVLLYIIVGFSLLMLGLEVFRIFVMNIQIEDALETVSRDAMELAMIDAYRSDHILIMDTDLAIEEFNRLFQEQFNLDGSFAMKKGNMLSRFVFTRPPEFHAGSYQIVGGNVIQTDFPYISIECQTTVKPMVLNVGYRIPLTFRIYTTENR